MIAGMVALGLVAALADQAVETTSAYPACRGWRTGLYLWQATIAGRWRACERDPGPAVSQKPICISPMSITPSMRTWNSVVQDELDGRRAVVSESRLSAH